MTVFSVVSPCSMSTLKPLLVISSVISSPFICSPRESMILIEMSFGLKASPLKTAKEDFAPSPSSNTSDVPTTASTTGSIVRARSEGLKSEKARPNFNSSAMLRRSSKTTASAPALIRSYCTITDLAPLPIALWIVRIKKSCCL